MTPEMRIGPGLESEADRGNAIPDTLIIAHDTDTPPITRRPSRAGAGGCGCQRPDLRHDTGCLWGLDRRPGRGPRLTLTDRVRALEGRVVKIEATPTTTPTTTPDAGAGGGSR